MKTILCVWHSGNKGKTEVLRAFSKKILESYPTFTPIYPETVEVPPKGDFRIIININGIKIGIESQGDPNTGLEGRLRELIDDNNCDLIICTSRTRGETVKAVDNVAKTPEYDCQTIWSSTYQIANNSNHSLVNELKGKHLLDLIETLKLL